MSLRTVLIATGALAAISGGAGAQEPDSIPDPERPGNCTLLWESLSPETFGTAVRDGPQVHTTYVSGRMIWTCGNATMEADSAVKYDRLRKVDLFGDVVYQDSIRTLQSRYLTYFEIEDLVVADEEVELVRLVDQSRLTGPHVEFLRAVSGVDELTTATGRPHMTFYPESDDPQEPQEPFEIDADRAQFAGEDEARFHGDVELKRSDVNAAADSAYLTRDDGVGLMWGSPWFEAEEVRLEGDTIRFRSEDEELKEVHAEGNGFALGAQFQVRSELIDIELANEEIEKVWSHGEGVSEALSGDHLLFGDSLRFAMFASKIDTIFAVGSAVGIQGDSTAASEGLKGVTPVDDLPTAGPGPGPARLDSIGAASDDPPAQDSVPARIDSAAVEPPTAEPPPVEEAGLEPPPVEERVELIEGLLSSVEVPDSLRARIGLMSGADSVEVAGSDDGSDPGFRGPPLSVDGSTNWVRGDTLVAIFARAGRPAPDSSISDSSPAIGVTIEGDPRFAAATDSLGELVGDSVASVMVDSALSVLTDSATIATADSVAEEVSRATALAAGPALPSAADLVEVGAAEGETSSVPADDDPVMELMTVIGHASSFYRQVRDSLSTEEPSRNYMIGDRIDILFEDGEPRTVLGENAIGVFLEPETATEAGAGAAPTRPVVIEPSTIPLDSTRTIPDSTGVRPDSTGARSDSTGARPDSTGARPDSTVTPPDSTRSQSRVQSRGGGGHPSASGLAWTGSPRRGHARTGFTRERAALRSRG